MRKLFRTAAVLAAGTMVVTMAGPAQAAPDDASARWLTRQLTDGLIHNDQFGDFEFDDYGLTADTAFALAAIGGQPGAVRDIRTALAQHVDSWTTGVDFGSTDVFAGSTAKAVVLAQTTGADPRAFGGVNLVARLTRRVSATAPTVGRIQDKTAGQDFANTIGQAFAAQGLSVAGSGKADEAVRFLLQQQCSPGYFRLGFAAKTARNQTCDGGDPRHDERARHGRDRARRAQPEGGSAQDGGRPDGHHRRRRVAQAQAEGERQLRRRYGDRGQQLQQHRAGRVGLRGDRRLRGGGQGGAMGARPAGRG